MYVKKIFLPTSIVCLLTIFFAFSSFKANSKKATNISAAPAVEKTSVEEDNTLSVEAASNLIYDSLHLADLGMSKHQRAIKRVFASYYSFYYRRGALVMPPQHW